MTQDCGKSLPVLKVPWWDSVIYSYMEVMNQVVSACFVCSQTVQDSATKHLKPLPKDSSFALSPAPSLEDDRALAARLQQEEYARGTSRQQLQLRQQGSSRRG